MRCTALVIPLLVLVTAGCSSDGGASPVSQSELRTVTVSGAGVGKTMSFTCGPAAKVCTHEITDAGSSVGSFTQQVNVPVGSTVHVQVRGIGPMSCRIADATDKLDYVKVIPEPGEMANCQYVVE
jgi:hypothetical protein